MAGDRLRLAEDGRVLLTLKRRYHDGTNYLVFEPTTFIERLAALVPRPHKNLTVYGGLLAPNAKLRGKVVAYGCASQPAQVLAASTEPKRTVDDGIDDSSCAAPPSAAKPRPDYT